MPDTSQAMGQPMGSDGDNASQGGADSTPHQARPATTASMQNLLAQYFETKHFAAPTNEAHIDSPDFESGHFEAARLHALSAPQSETRATTPQPGHASAPPAFAPMPAFTPLKMPPPEYLTELLRQPEPRGAMKQRAGGVERMARASGQPSSSTQSMTSRVSSLAMPRSPATSASARQPPINWKGPANSSFSPKKWRRSGNLPEGSRTTSTIF